MVKLGFWFAAPLEYSGGLNYIKNVLHALSLVNDGSIRPHIFFSTGIPPAIEAQFAPYATVIKTRLLERGTVPWFIQRVLERVGSMFPVTSLLKAHGIAVLSHAWFVYKGRRPFRIISWIPDFQYLHLPELFPTLDPDQETTQNQRIISQSDVVILSSHNALEDFKRIAPPEHRSRGVVLHFVSQPGSVASPAVTRDAIERKYGFVGKFFFLPNQFWAHKNHMVVLQAAKLLKDRGVDVLVLCTGNVRDYRVRSSAYIEDVYEFIRANGLQDHIKILGHIDYSDVLFMMKNSIAVINPSRFEGWSSSVEEAKSMGKAVVLSRIAVHVEQNPANARYFDPDDALELSRILADLWAAPVQVSDDEAARIARDALRERTVEFGKAYLEIVRGVARRSGSCHAAG